MLNERSLTFGFAETAVATLELKENEVGEVEVGGWSWGFAD